MVQCQLKTMEISCVRVVWSLSGPVALDEDKSLEKRIRDPNLELYSLTATLEGRRDGIEQAREKQLIL